MFPVLPVLLFKIPGVAAVLQKEFPAPRAVPSGTVGPGNVLFHSLGAMGLAFGKQAVFQTIFIGIEQLFLGAVKRGNYSLSHDFYSPAFYDILNLSMT